MHMHMYLLVRNISGPEFYSAPTEIVCPTLTNPENGQVVYLVHDGNVPRTVANYSCDAGYRLVGNVRRECIRIGLGEEWTGEAPTCQRKCMWSASNGNAWCMQQTKQFGLLRDGAWCMH